MKNVKYLTSNRLLVGLVLFCFFFVVFISCNNEGSRWEEPEDYGPVNSELDAILKSLPANTADNPHTVSLTVSNMDFFGGTLKSNSNKYVILDLSSSTIDNIPAYAFYTIYDYNTLAGFIMPDSVTSIGNSAFYYCSNLKTIDVANTNPVYSSVDGILYNKNKTILLKYPGGKTGTFNVPGSVTEIGREAFSYCTKLKSIEIPDSVTFIGRGAFVCTSLENVTLPINIKSIEYGTFGGCTSLININLPQDLTNIDDFAFSGCTSLTGIIIPDSVVSIGYSAFYRNFNLASINIPDGVISIEDRTFGNCTNLASIIIPRGVTSIGVAAFHHCTSLSSIIIPDSITSIGDGAFYSCTKLASVTFESIISSGRFSIATREMPPPFNPFPGDLWQKYIAGGIGTYTRTLPSTVWTKQ